jgi:uncharacterized protein (TIGR03067 family)
MVHVTTIVAAVAALLSICTFAAAAEPKSGTDGTWRPTSTELGGQKLPDEVQAAITLVIEGETYTLLLGPQPDKGTLKFDTAAMPMAMDIVGTDGPNKGRTILAIYELDGDTLRICYDLTGKARPTKFESPAGTQLFLVTYKRQP